MKKSSKIYVKAGEVEVGENPGVLTTLGLGSCVAVTLYDRINKLGGMIHYILPENPGDHKDTKYADTGIKFLVDKLINRGANKKKLKAKMIGGAVMFGELIENTEDSIGNRNISKGKEVLNNMDIEISGEDLGGNYGRSVEFNLEDGSVIIKSYSTEDKVI